MIAITGKDVCLSTTATGNPMFNTDGVMRTSISVEEGRAALDFQILKKQSYHYDEEAGEIEAIPHHFHLVRDTDGAMLDCPSVGEQFVPVQHRDVFDYIVNDIMPNNLNMKLEMVGTLHGLTTGIISMNFGDTFSIRGDKSPNALRMLYANPCNGSGRLVMGFHMVRIVCQNTLALAMRNAGEDGIKIKHTKNAEIKADGALEQIQLAAKSAVSLKHKAEVLASIGVDSSTMRRALDAIHPLEGLEEGSPQYVHVENMRAQVVHQFESGETAGTFTEKSAWTLFNSFSYPVFNEPKITSRTDKAQVAYLGMVGNVGEKVRGMFAKVGSVVGAW